MKILSKITVRRCLKTFLAVVFFLVPVLAARAVNLVQEFYLPMPEAQIYQANNTIISGTGSAIASTFSIVVTGNGTVIYYDQWEDGYETDLSNPTQSTTQIWGDGIDAHGIPPGFAHNPLGLPAGTVITLTNDVTQPRNPSTLLWDARDRIAATKALIISRAAWPVATGPVMAGAVSVLSTIDYGTNFISPVGQNLTNNLFKYVGMSIMAAQDNTSVLIDPNGNGVGTTNIVLNQGESYLVNGGIMTGGRVSASEPIQADLMIGHVGAAYAVDWFTLYPVAEWSSSYYTPVGSAATINQPAYVYLYNPGASAIIINYNTKVGSGSFSVPASNGVFQFQMPVSSGASFVSAGGQNFYALCTVAANNSSDTPYNWGFTLVPQAALTAVADVGWAPGSSDGTVDGSPVWVTTLANTTVYVDYHGDTNGPYTDPLGNKYDTNFTVTALQSLKIYDPTKNQTGMKVYTVDGTLLTAAWGEDADVAKPGDPYIDAGTTVIPFPTPVLKKTAVIVTNAPSGGLGIGAVIRYTVEVDNKGLLPLGNTVVIDAPTGNLTYVPNSTTFNTNAIPDNTSGTAFPLASPGYTIPVILSEGTSAFQYLAEVNAAGVVSNNVSIGGATPTVSVTDVLTPPPTNGATVTLNFSDINGLPLGFYSVGANVFVTMTNAAGNTSSNSAQTISVTVVDQTGGDLETIILTETGTNTGVFRNFVGLPTSATSGLQQQDGILNVTPGDTLSVSYTDPNYGDSATNTATISYPTPNKQLYLSINGSTNGTQDLNRSNPVFYAHSPTQTSVDIGSGSGTLSVLSTNSATNGTGGTTMTLPNVNVPAGSSEMLLVGVSFNPGSTVSSITYGGKSLSLATATGDGTYERVEIWELLSPSAGTSNVVISFGSAATDITAGAVVLNGVNQTTPFSATSTNGGNSTTPSVTIASAAGDQVFNVIASRSATSATTTGSGQVKYWALTSTGGGYTSMGAASLAPGASSVTNSWTTPSGTYWSSVAVSIQPAAGGGSGPATNATSFVQTPSFALPFTMPAGGTVTITNFITITNGTLSSGAAITATLQYGGTNIITLSNPTYSSTNDTLVWSGVLASNVTIPTNEAITCVVSNNVPGTAFHINYDSTNAPSVIVLPASSATVIQVNTLGFYDGPYPGGNLVTSPVAGSTLYVRAAVSDPFGSYDITSLGLAVTGPSPASSFTNTLTAANVVATNSFSKTYEYAWVTGPTAGGYNIAVTANEGTEGVIGTAVAGITTTFLDLGTPSSTEFISSGSGVATNSYVAGSPVCVSVTALDSITNPAVVQNITVTITSSTGDSEIVTLTETAANTGIYTGCINTSTNVVGTTNNGTLYAPVGSFLTASYTDPNNPSYSSSATATVQPAPGVPGVVMNKTILSPSGGLAGVGQSVTYNLQVVNSGSTTLPNLSINDSYSSATLSYSTASLAPATTSPGLLTWTNLGAFTPGQSTNITVTFTTLAVGTVTNKATANGVSATNTSSVTLLVNKAALNVTKVLLSPTNQPVAVGSTVVFRVTVQNVGNTVVNYLPMEDTFSSAYYQFVSATIAPNGSGAGSLLWTNLAYPTSLATNATITNTITMTVVGQGTPANNTATVDYATDVFGNSVPTSSSTVGVTTASASITGHVYNDINKTGIYSNGYTGLNGVTLQLFTDPNGDGNPSDGTLVQIATTDANGSYNLLNLNLGHYVVVETLLPGYIGSAPVNNLLALNVTNLAAYTNENFFQYVPAPSLYSTISGTVWNDAGGSGIFSVGDLGIPNVEIDLVQDLNTNGLADPGEPVVATVNTDTNGNYSLAGITPGHYVIHQVVPYGYYSTGDSQLSNNNQMSFVSTNGIVSTNNNFYDRQSPVAVNDTNSTVYAVPVTIYPLTNDISPNGDPLIITNIASSNGIVVINPDSTNLTFTPTNSGATTVTYTIADAHGRTSTAIISVSVTLAPLSVTTSNASRAYGQTNPVFTGSITGVASWDNITAAYGCSATTNSPVGPYAIVPSLVDPNNRQTNYNVMLNNGTLTVLKAATVVTWTNPVPITYGTPLSSNQLDAQANVPGTFAYNPTNTTVLNAGSNTLSVIFTPTDTVDYTSATNFVTLVVQPAPLTVTASNASRAYGQTNPAFTGSVIGVVNGDSITATYASAATTNSPAGPYPIVPTLVDPGHRQTNYNVTLNNGTLTVLSAATVVTWTNPAPVTYGTPLSSNQLDALANVPGTFVYNPTNGTVLNAGSNTLSVVFTPTDTVDYNSATNFVTLVVQPAPLTVTASNASRAYGQTNPAFTGSVIGVVNGDNITATYASSAVTNSPAGPYPIVPTLVDPGHRQTNYNVTLNNGTLIVTVAATVVTWTNPAPVIYGTPLSSNQLDAIANVPGTFVYNPTNGTVLNTGSNTLSVVFTPTDTNDYNGATNFVTLVVQPAPLTVTASNANRIFGLINPLFTGSITGVTNGDNISATYATTATILSPAGLYPIIPTLVDPGHRQTNYNVTTNDGTLAVMSANTVVTWTNPTPVIYGAPLSSNQLDAIANVPGTFVYNLTNGTVLNASSNTLSVVFTPTDTNDYNSATNFVTLVVQPAPLTVTASNASRAYGQTNPVFTGSVVGVVNGDNITATYASAAVTNSPAGPYPIIPTLVDPGHRQTNYNVTLSNGTLTVLSAATVVTWTNPVPIIYGTPLSSNQLDALANVPGAFAYNPTNTTVLNASTNTLSVVFTPTDTVDYNSATNFVTLVVQPAPLTVTANNASRAYGQTNPAFTGVVTGVVNGDNITATYASSAVTNSPAGPYPIVPTLVDPGQRQTNYNVTLTNGTLTVLSAATVVTWTNPAPIIYGAPSSSNQLDAQANVPGTFVYNPTNTTVLNAGTNTLSAVFTPTDTVDYNSATNTVTLVVLPAPLSVTAGNASRAYGQTNPVFTGSVIGVVNGDNITATYASAATANSPTGTYSIIPTLVDPNNRQNNYNVTLTNGTLTVAPAADIAVLMTGLTTVAPGSNVTYIITVTNLGPDTAANVVVTDNVPNNVTLSSATAGGTTNGNVVIWSIGNLTNGQASNLTVTVTAPASGSFTNWASSTSTTFDPDTNNNNGTALNSQVPTTVLTAQFGIPLAGIPVLNPQTGLYEEQVDVTNTGLATILGVRLYVGGLPANVVLYNASGTNASNTFGTNAPYAQYNSSLDPNSNVTFMLEFYDPYRVQFTNSFDAEVITNILRPAPNPAGATKITRMFMDPRTTPPRFVIEFATVPGNSYTIIYSDDNMVTWKVATPTITAGSTSTQWYDDGPPETDVAPSMGRLYGIIANP